MGQSSVAELLFGMQIPFLPSAIQGTEMEVDVKNHNSEGGTLEICCSMACTLPTHWSLVFS